jgi:hypothetical protein
MKSSTRRDRVVRRASWIVIACLVAPLTPARGQARPALKTADLQPRNVPAKGLVVPTLGPGEVLTFSGPDAVHGVAESGSAGGASYIEGETPLRAYAYGFLPLQSSAASIFQYNDVTIAESAVPGGATGNVVSAQISGTASARGFLYALGAVEARAAVDVEVLDVTDPEAEVLLASQRIAEYSVDSRTGASIGGGVDVEGHAGFPYVGMSGGGSIDADIHLEPILRFVRDDVAYGFPVLLQRGHTYRVQVELSTDAELRLFGGTAIASFFEAERGGPVVPNALDPDPSPGTKGAENTWLSLLEPLAGAVPDLQIAKGEADVVSGSVDVGGGDFEFASVWNQSIIDVLDPLGFGFVTGSEKTKKLHGHDLLDLLFTTPPLSISQLVTSSPFLDVKNETGREIIVLPGIAVLGPTIALDNDRVELEDRAVNRVIEENLAQGRRLASMYLPATNGGALERCMAVVNALITESQAAGLDTAQAEAFMAKAVEAQGKGKYKAAYRHLHDAYVRLTRGL